MFYFGVPDDDSYPISMRTMLRNNLTLKSGVTLDRAAGAAAGRRVRARASRPAAQLRHPHLRGRRRAGRVRAGLPAGARAGQDRDRRCDARADCRRRWPRKAAGVGRLGGRARPIIGPEEFAQAGYDYVGFDTQHGYLDDADVALMLRRLEHVPIATAVRLPSADPAPIGRVLDAGADAVIIAMVEIGRAGRRRRWPPPATRPRGAQLRAAARRASGSRPAALEARAGVYVMIETAAALARPRRDLRRARAGRCLRRSRGSGDLAGVRARPTCWTHRRCATRCQRIQHVATAAGLVTGVHASDGNTGNAMARVGIPDDHAGLGVAGAAPRCGRTPQRGDGRSRFGRRSSAHDQRVQLTVTRRPGRTRDRRRPRAGRRDRHAAARRRIPGRRLRCDGRRAATRRSRRSATRG